ncbi:leucine rich repeat protein [Metarhizium album ARSEF 1941]|uniref:Leucine rich repeat protein n=1 Tax=Metarhizium album (strain ARSEF 1941) TaxID=1081103 RepID=A0A0B2WGG9_METAS|nr:leucine rich repeat protein [Metarhizium album ARSEF 1941]KHN95101.1 leucine rich repeat protein [Metarhizium album ARSEF 1941]
MNVERWKRRSASVLSLNSPATSYYDAKSPPQPTESKAPRVLTRALRSLSSSSMDSITATSTRSNSIRKLQKTPSSSSSVIDRLQRRVSKDSPTADRPGSPTEQLQPYSAMEVLQCGSLKADVSLLKAKSEYLVLSDQVLVKFNNGDSARVAFPQLFAPSSDGHNASSCHHATGKLSSGDVRLEISLRSIVAAFNEDSTGNRSGIEIWWFSPWPKLAYSKAHLYFALPGERDVWLASIHRAVRAKLRKSSRSALISDNLRSRIDHIVRASEGSADAGYQSTIFPVARRVFGGGIKGSTTEDAPDSSDISSFFLIIGPCMCHFVEVLKADHATPPGDLRVKAISYGTVTLTRFKASVVSHEHRFVMCFRSPFGRETRVDLASSQYRRIIETLTKADRILKPMWPQHFQQVIFDIRGLPPPLQLTSGNDLGGLRRSLEAYCAAYQVRVPNWTIDWSPPPQPAFRLLPSDGRSYSPMQLLAVFRALRYNSFFKAISFRGVDLSSLAGRNDKPKYGDSLAYKSLNGVTISEEHHEILLQSPILEQEIHALLFASESIRSLDMSDILGIGNKKNRLSRYQYDLTSLSKATSEILRPFLELWRRQLCICHSISLSGNPIAPEDLDELADLLTLDQVHLRRIDLSNCSLGDAGLSKLWVSLAGQTDSLEWIDTSNNQGVVRFEIIQSTLSGLRRLSKLDIAGNTRITSEESLFDELTMQDWHLQELDLSEPQLNDATVDVLSNYLQTASSRGLHTMRLNNCGLTGGQLARLFYAMGRTRPVELYVGGSRLDEGVDDLCMAITEGHGPWCLFVQMVEFAMEANYIKLLRALTVNTSIECLSLAGTSTPDAASSVACQAIADFFAKNCTVRFLDISGFDSRLDEGRLGREFSKALISLKTNESIEHLRVRSQMLNINIGDLAEAISENKTLHTLDCEGNDFNLSNYRHLVSCLDQNTTTRYFSAFSAEELKKATSKSVETAVTGAPVRRPSVISRFKSDKIANGSSKPLVQRLKDEWDTTGSDLRRILRRNQIMSDDENAAEPDESSSQEYHRNSTTELAFSTAFGGLPLMDLQRRRAKGVRSSQDPQQAVSGDLAVRRHSRHGSGGSRELATRPVSMISSEIGASLSTEEDSYGSSGVPTPPEVESPIEELGLMAEILASAIMDESNYTCSDGHDAEDGLQVKRCRRYMGDPTSRIDEEDGATDTESA